VKKRELIRHERELREAWQVSHLALHGAEVDNLRIARDEINRRLNEMNELRSQITAERGEFLRRDMFDREHANLRDGTDSRLKVLEQAKSNLDGRVWAIGAGITILTVLLQFAMRYFTKG